MIRSRSLRTHELVGLRVRALRRRVWFRILNRMERGLIDSVIKVVDVVRSTLLTRVLRSIMKKLSDALESKVARMIREVGRPLAKKLGLIAQVWGNKSSRRWSGDEGFVQYLAVTAMNAPSPFKL